MSSSGDSGPGQREVAYRLFATEFDDSEFDYSESDEERAPNYVVTPTGARVNRLFAVGVLTEVEDVNPEMVRGRVVDPTGAFVTYAGQYQPDALTFLERADPPTFLAVSGKARTFEPDDGDRIYTSVRPESVSEVDAETRDRWVVTTAERTLERIGIMASAIEADLAGEQLRAALIEEGVDDRLADGVALALDYYGTTPAYLDALRETALDALRVVAGEKDEVGRLDVAPDEGLGDASALATLDLSGAPSPETAAAAAGVGGTESDSPNETEATTETSANTESISTSDPEADTEEPESVSTSEAELETEPETEPERESKPESEPESAAEAESEPTETLSEAAAESEATVSESDPVAEPEAESTSEPDPAEEAGVSEDFDPGEFELDEEERREVEEEYGTEFSTADEVEPADIETPDPEGSSEPDAELAGSEEPTESEPRGTAEEVSEADGTDEAVDLEDAVMETMEALDDGDGADHAALVSTLVEEHGVATEAVEEAIQDALMSGRCYEPSDGVLKSI